MAILDRYILSFIYLIRINYISGNDAAQSSSSERTLYACTGSSLSLECADDAVIAVTRANYGRFSIAVCNDFGRTDWSVNCFSQTARDILKERSANIISCQIPYSLTSL